VAEITAQLYPAVGSELNFAARAMVHAQLIALVRLGNVSTDGEASADSTYRLQGESKL